MSDPRRSRHWWPTNPVLAGCLTVWGIALGALLIGAIYLATHAIGKDPSATCLAHVKELTRAELMYAEDHSQRLPPVPAWPAVVSSYVSAPADWLCPSDRRNDKQQGGGLATSYAMSVACGGAISKMPGAQNVGVLFDGDSLYGTAGSAAFRHRQGINLGFADGHAKWVSQGDFAAVPLSPAEAAGQRPSEEAPKP